MPKLLPSFEMINFFHWKFW